MNLRKKKKDIQAMSRKELINEISDVTQIKRDIVDNVLKAFTDIFIRECVMTGSFNFNRAFKVETHVRSERKQYNVNTGKYLYYPETEVLSIKLSPKINSFHRWKLRNEYNAKHGLTISDWQNLKNTSDNDI